MTLVSRTSLVTIAAGAMALGLAAPVSAAAPTSVAVDRGAAATDPSRLTMSERRIGTAWFPATLSGVKRNVNPYFGWSDGTSVEVVDPCMKEVTGETFYVTAARWDEGLQVMGMSQTRPVKIDSYRVTTAAASRRLNLPYSVGVGNSYTYLKAKAGWMRVDKTMVFNDGYIYSRGDVYWFMNRSNTQVKMVAVNPYVCE